MSQIPSVFNSSAANRSPSSVDAINDLDLSTFLDLMIAELQNQDPLDPLDNKDMLAQISQIREVGATDRLTQTLESVLLGQNIASATNLIGADITALSDEGESVTGSVNHVSIENGAPKLHIELRTEAVVSDNEGHVDAGTHAYRIIWEDDKGNLHGIELSGDQAVRTANGDKAIQIRNLPVTAVPKHVYRTDATGQGTYKLVGVIPDGSQGSFLDVVADDERSETRLTRPFQSITATARSYQVSLKNVSGIRPPTVAAPVIDEPGNEEADRRAYSPSSRPAF